MKPDSLGAQVLARAGVAITEASGQLSDSLRSVNDLPLLWRWLSAEASDPAARAQIGDALGKLGVIFLLALLAEFVARLGFLRVRRALVHATPPTHATELDAGSEPGLAAAEAGQTELDEKRSKRGRSLGGLRRLPFLLGRLFLGLLPVAVFLAVAEMLLGTGLGAPERVRDVVLIAVEDYVTARVLIAFGDFLFAPAAPRFRLLHLSQWAARLLTQVVRRTVVVAAAGFALADTGQAFGMWLTAHDMLLKLFALVIHLGFVVAVLQARRPVAERLRARAGKGPWAAMLGRFADTWHLFAIFFIVALWIVWAIELRNGYVRLAGFCLSTAAVLIAARIVALLLLGGLERLRAGLAGSGEGSRERGAVYFPIVRAVLVAVLWGATGFVLLEAWGFSPLAWLVGGGLGGRVLSAVLLIGVTGVAALATWETANTAIERHLAQLSQSAQVARAGRLRTLLPLLRTVLMITILLVVGLMVLSELGVNIAPLLAGAGVVGIAVGFGSQKLVQDLITGLFLLLENAMQVGDVVTVAGLSGTVEALSIRSLRLRALDGAVHLIPFSAVTTVTNQTRDYSYALVDVSVGLNEEPDPIADVLREIADSLRQDPAWHNMVLDKLDVMGVEKLTDLAWIMRIRMKTQPGSRWAVARELNRRIKVRFDELAIESPFTSHRALGREPPPPAAAAAPVPEQEQAA